MVIKFLLNTPIFLSVVALLTLVFVLLVLRLRFWISSKEKRQNKEIKELEKRLRKANQQLLEFRSIVVGLGEKVSGQQGVVENLRERVFKLEYTDDNDRLYTRATKMVQLGAELHELIEECELPKAEAEFMMSLQKKLTGQEKIPPLEINPDTKS
ncbi:DNA repair ATPase [Candidatus Photodesmus blepharus]|uniref:DNA repair ATPase n=1 Tax=Candidatus Photodesmus blepharonis TaxID=1179155 RepID=A0A084CMX1_9GAMM|nr:DUF2802 domain-containing protein [Candidatus Photodesmus blepharus]KEY91150.1 DNA repair ATPase [Candidatus Photodesmus blepharus]